MILNPIDQRIRDEGFNFVPFDRFLAERFVPKTLDMSGGISTLPILPLINPYQGSGDDRDRFDTPDPVDEGLLTADFAPDQSMTGIMGMTDEEQEAINAMKNPGLTKGQMAQIGFGLVTNPIGAIFNARRIRKQNEARALERAQEAAAQADFDRAMAQGQDFYDSLNEGRGATSTAESRATAGDDPGYSGPSPFADGGRAGYQEGGSIEARLEQLGGDVTSAEQMLQGINERLQSAESSLGSGGGLGSLPSGIANNMMPSVQTPDPFMGDNIPDGLVNRPLLEFPKPQNLEQPIQTPSGQVQAFEQAFPGIPDSRPMGLAAADGTMSFLKPVPPEQQMEQFNTSQGKLSPEERVTNAERSLLTRDMKTQQQLDYIDRVVKSGGMDYLVDLDYFNNSKLGTFQQPTFGTGGQGVMGGSRSPLQTALGFADGGIADMLDIYD